MVAAVFALGPPLLLSSHRGQVLVNGEEEGEDPQRFYRAKSNPRRREDANLSRGFTELTTEMAECWLGKKKILPERDHQSVATRETGSVARFDRWVPRDTRTSGAGFKPLGIARREERLEVAADRTGPLCRDASACEPCGKALASGAMRH
jgi:hypothetical protein